MSLLKKIVNIKKKKEKYAPCEIKVNKYLLPLLIELIRLQINIYHSLQHQNAFSIFNRRFFLQSYLYCGSFITYSNFCGKNS